MVQSKVPQGYTACTDFMNGFSIRQKICSVRLCHEVLTVNPLSPQTGDGQLGDDGSSSLGPSSTIKSYSSLLDLLIAAHLQDTTCHGCVWYHDADPKQVRPIPQLA